MTQRSSVCILVLMVGLMVSSFRQMHRSFPWPYPPISQLVTERTGMQDASLITAGFRALAADIAWIQLLQYTGGWILQEETQISKYLFLKDMTLRVVRIDPFFRQAYLFSSGMLAFFSNLDRPQEALDILQEGIRANPTYWPFRTLVAAIGFRSTDQFEEMARMLEDAIRDPDCPAITKSILANAYKLHHRDSDALRVWQILLDDPQATDYHAKARREIATIESQHQ